MKIDQLFHSFSQKNVVVIGDVMLDSYLKGDVKRISPEAPVPIVNLNQKEDRLGGAANVALNLIALGAKVFIASVVGADESGEEMENLFKAHQIHCEALIKSGKRKTTVKTRILGNNQQLLRVDSEQSNDLSESEQGLLLKNITKLLDKEHIDAIIFEDYNKGLLTKNVIEKVIEMANERKIITTVDPKKDNFFAYKNVTLFKPNLKELKEGVNVQFDARTDFDAFEDALTILEKMLKNKISFVTLSELGVFIKDKRNKIHIPAHIRNIADVSGAGDTVISVATLCLAAGLKLENIAQIANISGGLVCEEVGVVSIDKEKLKKEIIRIIGSELK